MATETTVLARNSDGSPALWLETADGVTTLNDENTSIPFDPQTEDIDAAVAQWKASVDA